MSANLRGQMVVVVGYGVSGRAAAEVLLAEGALVRATEARPLEALATPDGASGPADARFELRAGGHRPEHLDGASLVVVSPGVPQASPVMAWARERALPVWSELELGARLCRVPYVGITGTNGKTTTTEMVAAMMRAAGVVARACGNVGYPFSLAAREEGLDALAVEASSFQLAFQESFHPQVSVLLNVAPDHLDWHGTLEAYAAAKAMIYAHQGAGDIHIGNRDDPTAARISEQAPCETRWFRWGSPGEGDVGVVDGRVVAGDGTLLGKPLGSGRAFLSNTAAAAAAASAFGVPQQAMRDTIGSFAPLPHRGAVVAKAGSVRFVDDSKATNPHAALAALESLTDAVLIAGGQAKGVDLSPLASAAPKLAAVVAIGESAPALVRIFEGLSVPVTVAATMEEAVESAYGLAPRRGTVILAPACASQDMFRDYRERGDRFAAAARAVAARARGSGPIPRRSHA
jgi:UDP-N-acetylmuramoylalanine--D-glutamate ligase